MRMTVLFLLTYAISACSQTSDDRIRLRILDSVVIRDGNTKISFRLECKNLTDSTFLLYGIDGDTGSFPKKVDELRNYLSKMSAWNRLYIYDNEMKEIKMNTLPMDREFHRKYRKMPKERADSIVSAGNAKYLKYTKVIAKEESISLQKDVDLKPYELTKGTYYLQIAYCSGDKISFRVAPEQIDRDKEVHSATVFRGCAISNVVRFEIN